MIPLKDDNPQRHPPTVTLLLIGLCVVAFGYELSLPEPEVREMIFRLGLVPSDVTQGLEVGSALPVLLATLTSMFLHGDLMHLAGNMLYLWIFGGNVEDELGHAGFLVFYVLCGAVAAAAQVAVRPDSTVPMVGASGAIAGVLGAYMLLFPHARVLTLVPIFVFLRLMYLPAAVVLGLWFLYQILLSGMTNPAGGGIAFFAHIGGFVGGMALVWLFRRSRPRHEPS